MNFYPQSSNYLSANQQQSQQNNVSAFNNGNFGQNVIPTITGYPFPYSNNYPYQYPGAQHANYNQNSFNNFTYSNTTPDISLIAPKREVKPLVVFDPQKNEAVDLVKASKTTASNNNTNTNQNSKVSVSLNTILVSEHHESHPGVDQSVNSYKDQSKKKEYSEEEIEESDESESSDYIHRQQLKEQRNDMSADVDSEISEDLTSNDDTNVIQNTRKPTTTMKCSQSIPNKIESLSSSIGYETQPNLSLSEDNLHPKSSSSNNQHIMETEPGRLIYDRVTLLKLAESPLCRPPELDCKEIIAVQSDKVNNLTLKLKQSNSLKRTKHGYLPPNVRVKELCSTNVHVDKFRRSFKSILNRIAPQNFKICFAEIKILITDTDLTDVSIKDCMRCLIEEIFDKAVQEEAYSVTYADLCTQIVKYEESHDTNWSFKKTLMERCKNMFETPLQDQLDAVRKYWINKVQVETDDVLKNLYKSDIEEQVKKARDKYFGNIRFIGELFLHDLLKIGIIHNCAGELLLKPKEENAMLSLCKLLETCGKKFDQKNSEKMDEHINEMTEISKMEDLPVRIRFRLLDIIEMRNRNWALRNIQAQKIIQPKTLEQVKQDDIDDKVLEASKLANQTQIRLSKKTNINHGEIKFKPQQNKNQSMEFHSLQTPSNNDIQLKPSYGLWAAGSSVKDCGWQSVDGKRSTRYNKHTGKHSNSNTKSSTVTSRDESPSKVDIGGRFALLQQDDMDNSTESNSNSPQVREPTPDIEERSGIDVVSISSTREQSPSNSEYISSEILDGDGILDKLLDFGYFDVNSWCQLKDVSQTIACWLDKIMEKNKHSRNILGDQLATLMADGKLTIEDLVEGLKLFSEDINDLKTDIPLIWDFLAEFLERFIVDSQSDFQSIKVVVCDSLKHNNTDATNCISLCFKYAKARLGNCMVNEVMTRCDWPITTEQECILSKEYFSKFREEFIALLPNDDEMINQFLVDKFGLEMIQTEACVYFVLCCVFSYISHLTSDDITSYLCKQKLFFLRLLDRRSEFEKQALDALTDSIALFSDQGLLTSVIYGLSDNILTNDAFQHYIERYDNECEDYCGVEKSEERSSDSRIVVDMIRSMFESTRR